MKAIKFIIAAIVFLCLSVFTYSQNYSTLSEVISSGGNESTGGNYSNFGVVGETFVTNSVAGGNYNSSIGFLYGSEAYIGVTEIEATNFFRIYPNPTNGEINIDYISTKPVLIGIYNSFGKIILLKNLEKIINISKLPNGLYFLKFVDDNGTIIHSRKIIKY